MENLFINIIKNPKKKIQKYSFILKLPLQTLKYYVKCYTDRFQTYRKWVGAD